MVRIDKKMILDNLIYLFMIFIFYCVLIKWKKTKIKVKVYKTIMNLKTIKKKMRMIY